MCATSVMRASSRGSSLLADPAFWLWQACSCMGPEPAKQAQPKVWQPPGLVQLAVEGGPWVLPYCSSLDAGTVSAWASVEALISQQA